MSPYSISLPDWTVDRMEAPANLRETTRMLRFFRGTRAISLQAS